MEYVETFKDWYEVQPLIVQAGTIFMVGYAVVVCWRMILVAAVFVFVFCVFVYSSIAADIFTNAAALVVKPTKIAP